MADAAGPDTATCTVDVAKKIIRGTCAGWHHMTLQQGMHSTSMAVLFKPPKNNGNVLEFTNNKAQFNESAAENNQYKLPGAIIEERIRNICAVDLSNCKTYFDFYIRMLHNKGSTLQERPELMVMTRSPHFLVRGAASTHIGTVCRLDGYVCLTDAHELVQATIITDLHKLVLSNAVSTAPPHSLAHLCYADSNRKDRFMRASSIRSMLTTYSTVKETCPVAMYVQATMAAAIMHTGFSDAGSRFRDRTSRHEAARHYHEAINAIVLSKTVIG